MNFETKRTRDHEGCPACSSKLVYASISNSRIRQCSACQAIFGSCYLGDSYAMVAPFFSPVPATEERYFDFECLGSRGITRRHGWYNPANGMLTQTG